MGGPPPGASLERPAAPAEDVELSALHRRAQDLFAGTRGQLIFVLFVVAIIGLEAIGFYEFTNSIPASGSASDSLTALQTVPLVAGVLLALTGVLVMALIARGRLRGRLFELLFTMSVTVTLYLLALVSAFYAILAGGSRGYSLQTIVGPVEFLVYATSVLFFGMAVYLLQE